MPRPFREEAPSFGIALEVVPPDEIDLIVIRGGAYSWNRKSTGAECKAQSAEQTVGSERHGTC